MRRCAATLAVALGVGTATLLPGAPAAVASTPRYVAIVIAGHGTYCVRAGGSGDSVLNAVVQVGYRPSDHIIWQIDNYPSPPRTDSTHYWSYWHDTSGRWAYATTGASGYTPPAGSVEGWVFGDGSAPPPRNPSGLYAALCGYLDAPPPPSRTTAPVVHPTTPRPPASHAPATPTPRRVTPPSSAGVLPVSAHRTSAPAASRSPARATTPRTSVSAPSSTASASVATSGVDVPATPATTTRAEPKTDRGSAAPALAGVGIAALVAAGGGWAAWRRRRA